jgi:hypothetical protein
MGGGEEAAGATGHTGEAQEAEDVGGGVEGHKGSDEEKVGGLPQGPRFCSVIPTPADSRRSNALDSGYEPSKRCSATGRRRRNPVLPRPCRPRYVVSVCRRRETPAVAKRGS